LYSDEENFNWRSGIHCTSAACAIPNEGWLLINADLTAVQRALPVRRCAEQENGRVNVVPLIPELIILFTVEWFENTDDVGLFQTGSKKSTFKRKSLVTSAKKMD
jgi:hypothetical protein